MINNRKFEEAANRRRNLALWFAILLHVAAIAAITNAADLKKYMPVFVQNWFDNGSVEEPQANLP